MTEQSLTPVIEKLEIIFSKLNGEYFDGQLKKPVITVTPDNTNSKYGWCTGWKAWTDKAPKAISEMTADEIAAAKDEGFYEINLCAEYIARPFEDVVGTMLHEMVHLFNIYAGVRDTSRNGFYHNKRFKEAAEAHGLIVKKGSPYGYYKTTLTDTAKIFAENNLDGVKFDLYRKPKTGGTKKSASRSRKYVCPCCGAIIRATREVRVVCGDCDITFVEAVN